MRQCCATLLPVKSASASASAYAASVTTVCMCEQMGILTYHMARFYTARMVLALDHLHSQVCYYFNYLHIHTVASVHLALAVHKLLVLSCCSCYCCCYHCTIKCLAVASILPVCWVRNNNIKYFVILLGDAELH
jgi:hypothetical protein